MLIIVEDKIPYIQGLLEPYADVMYLPPEHITPSAVKDADALLVRTRTRCDERLLAGSRVKFIGTATIGTDHIDMDYCHNHGIAVYNAPGCNAPAVAQWVLATIAYWMDACDIEEATQLKLGVVGFGHVGSIVCCWATLLGFDVVTNDPPLGLYDDLSDCDIITFHTPLTRDGQWPTWHMCDRDLLERASSCRLLLNAARGGVCDEQALLQWDGDVAIDCWENEPAINEALLEKAFVATPHIAGYSIQGKQRGTAMIVEALNEHFGFKARVSMPSASPIGNVDAPLSLIAASYNPLMETAILRRDASRFEYLRNHYALRPEV